MSTREFVHHYVPPRGDSSRTLLVLHGPDDEDDLPALVAEIAPEAGLLALREEVPAEVVRRTTELADFVREAAERYAFDPHEVWVVGYATGASVAASVLMRRPETLAGGALLHATAPPAPEEPPCLEGKPIFLGAGENDPLVPVEATTHLHTMLHRYGADVRTAWFRDGHALSTAEMRAVGDWLDAL